MSTLKAWQQFTWGGIVRLFLVVAFPIHLWSIILVIRDVDFVTERTNAWDALGYGAYSLSFALFESLVIFLVVYLLGYLLPRRWEEDKAITFLSTIYLVVAIWGILGQTYFMLDQESGTFVYRALFHIRRLDALFFPLMLVSILASAALPYFLVERFKKINDGINAVLERLILLSGLYIFFDLISILIVIYRNIS